MIGWVTWEEFASRSCAFTNKALFIDFSYYVFFLIFVEVLPKFFNLLKIIYLISLWKLYDFSYFFANVFFFFLGRKILHYTVQIQKVLIKIYLKLHLRNKNKSPSIFYGLFINFFFFLMLHLQKIWLLRGIFGNCFFFVLYDFGKSFCFEFDRKRR